jgi:hypothetical protein
MSSSPVTGFMGSSSRDGTASVSRGASVVMTVTSSDGTETDTTSAGTHSGVADTRAGIHSSR